MTASVVKRRRGWIVGLAAALTGLCLMVKTVADQTLAEHPVDFGPLELRLAFNPGVAFSLGDRLPSAAIVVVTAAVTLGVLVLALRLAPSLTRLGVAGFAAVLAGAVSNLADRAADGVVTDYFHTGWYPTFNLPDVLITIGAGSILLSTLRQNSGDRTANTEQSSAC